MLDKRYMWFGGEGKGLIVKILGGLAVVPGVTVTLNGDKKPLFAHIFLHHFPCDFCMIAKNNYSDIYIACRCSFCTK
jgi:hypothetical protein